MNHFLFEDFKPVVPAFWKQKNPNGFKRSRLQSKSPMAF